MTSTDNTSAPANPFEDRFTIAGLEFGPISPPVIAGLRRRGNRHFKADSDREQDSLTAAFEILYLCQLTPEQRREHFRDAPEVWDDHVLAFASGLPDNVLEDFVALLERTPSDEELQPEES